MFVGRYMCPKCGTEVYTEVCHNCKTKTDVNITKLLIEGKRVYYRDYKSEIIPYLIASLTVIILLSIFAYSQFIESVKLYEHGCYDLIVICAIICVIIFLIGITPLIKYILLMKFGHEEEVTVLGYEGDTVPRNGKFKRYIDLLTNIDGRMIDIVHFIESSVEEPYPINSKIKIKIRRGHLEIIEDNNSQLK